MRALASKNVPVYWCIGLVAAALLIAFSVKPSALTSSTSHVGAIDNAVSASVMASGGQFEKPPLW